jgi:16S rRNA (cytosine967-C5)-methyltransferase
MTPEARIGAAAEVLELILAGEPAEKALTSWGRRSRFAGSKDRAAVRDHVFDALRCKRSFAVLGGGLSGRGLMIGLLRSEGRDPAQVFTGQGHAPAPLTEQEAAGGSVPEGADALDLPDWIVPELQASLGDPAPLAQVLRSRAPVMLRVNLRKSSVSKAVAQLAADGIVAAPVSVSPTALLVSEGARRVNGSAAYLQGMIELQDGASQAVVDRLPLRDGMRVLDYCAGGGGKTLAMAGRARAEFFAHDANPRRLKDLPVRADRAGVSIKLLENSGLSGAGPFDLVLCDAPCSGSGAWRRSPEGKWVFDASALAELTQIQDEILDQAQGLVAQNGVLAYATCSVLRAENDARVDAFLARHPDWDLQWSQQWFPGPEGDGFFACCLTKSPK